MPGRQAHNGGHATSGEVVEDTGFPVVVALPGLHSAGERHSWYGVAEVCGRGVMRSSMAHAASLGRAVAASGLCVAWPDQTFRFTIAAPGDTLTISASMGHPAQPAGAAAMPTEQAPARTGDASSFGQPGGGAGNALPPGRRAHVPDGTATGRFYQALDQLAENLGGPRRLRDWDGVDGWPRQGVYFFFEPGEVRADGRDRVVRVGTHALTAASQATLWGRLRQHRGHVGGLHPGGGNHRASVFRRHVGAAIIQRGKLPPGLLDSWLDRHGPRPGHADQEARIEKAVSGYIGAMPFLWLAVGQRADRGRVERNSIALTSCLADGLEQPSGGWLGHDAARTEISQSGLWNIEHIRHHHEPGFGLKDVAGKTRKRVALELVVDLERVYARKKVANKELVALIKQTGTGLSDLQRHRPLRRRPAAGRGR